MSNLEDYVIYQMRTLVPNATDFKVRANIGDKSCSVEFFAVIDDVEYQCYDMIDRGLIKEKNYENFVKQLAKYIRNLPEYCPGEINKFYFVTDK